MIKLGWPSSTSPLPLSVLGLRKQTIVSNASCMKCIYNTYIIYIKKESLPLSWRSSQCCRFFSVVFTHKQAKSPLSLSRRRRHFHLSPINEHGWLWPPRSFAYLPFPGRTKRWRRSYFNIRSLSQPALQLPSLSHVAAAAAGRPAKREERERLPYINPSG